MANHQNSSDHNQQNEQHGRLHDVRETATHAYETARTKAKEALGPYGDKASDAARRAAEGIDSNPLGILVGGLAIGVLAGALIPRSAREKELLAPLGAKIGTRARTAFEAARSAGMDELGNRGLTRDGVRDQAKGVLDGVVKALSSAGTAAAQSARSGNANG